MISNILWLLFLILTKSQFKISKLQRKFLEKAFVLDMIKTAINVEEVEILKPKEENQVLSSPYPPSRVGTARSQQKTPSADNNKSEKDNHCLCVCKVNIFIKNWAIFSKHGFYKKILLYSFH